MVIKHSLSNFLSNLQNHSLAKKHVMTQYKTKLIIQLINVLVVEGFLRGYKLLSNNKVEIYLKDSRTNFTRIRNFSTPNKRKYITNTQLYKKNLQGLYIISTTQGLLTHYQARKLNIGGELICYII